MLLIASPVSITLYGKPGCCLCDEARAVIEAVRAEIPIELEELDVSRDPGLHARYGERVPVVVVDGIEAFEYHVDRDELERRLGAVDPPGSAEEAR